MRQSSVCFTQQLRLSGMQEGYLKAPRNLSRTASIHRAGRRLFVPWLSSQPVGACPRAVRCWAHSGTAGRDRLQLVRPSQRLSSEPPNDCLSRRVWSLPGPIPASTQTFPSASDITAPASHGAARRAADGRESKLTVPFHALWFLPQNSPSTPTELFFFALWWRSTEILNSKPNVTEAKQPENYETKDRPYYSMLCIT